MKVSVKSFGLDVEVKNKGIELEIRNTNDNHLGDLTVSKAKLIWRKGGPTGKRL